MIDHGGRFLHNPGLLDYVRKLVKLDEMIRAGTDETPEGEELRDSMDKPWYMLDDEELSELRAISADLGGREATPFPAVSNEPLLVELRGLRTAADAMSTAELANARGRVWQRAGEYGIAAEFYRMAAELEPESATYRTAWIDSRGRAEPTALASDASKVLASTTRESR